MALILALLFLCLVLNAFFIKKRQGRLITTLSLLLFYAVLVYDTKISDPLCFVLLVIVKVCENFFITTRP